MTRITQNLFEEIQKITSGQLDEKKKHDEDGDGDEDAADYMMKRRKAGGQSHAQAHAATRKHNEEAEQEDAEQLDEVGDTPAGKKALGSYIKKRTKQLPQIEVGYQMAPSDKDARMVNKYKKKVNKGIGRAVDRLTKEEAEIEEAWPGTKEYKEKFPKDEYAAHMQKFGGDPNAPRATKGRYGYAGASGSDTEEKPEDTSKPKGRGRKAGGSKLNKLNNSTIINHDDFIVMREDKYSFKEYLNAAKRYVETEEQAIAVAESFYKDDDSSLVLESEIKYLYGPVLEEYRKEGLEVTEMTVYIDGDDAEVVYSVTESDTIRTYVHQGKIIKGEE